MEDHEIFLFNLKMVCNGEYIHYQKLKQIYITINGSTESFSRNVKTLQKSGKLKYISSVGRYIIK